MITITGERERDLIWVEERTHTRTTTGGKERTDMSGRESDNRPLLFQRILTLHSPRLVASRGLVPFFFRVTSSPMLF